MFTMFRGDIALSPEFDYSNALSHQISPEQSAHKWYKHFFKHVQEAGPRYEMPRPRMYNDEPCWIGDLKPEGSAFLEDGYVWVSTMKCKHVIVHESKLREPDNSDYIEHFKKPVQSYHYRISSSKRNKSEIRTVINRAGK